MPGNHGTTLVHSVASDKGDQTGAGRGRHCAHHAPEHSLPFPYAESQDVQTLWTRGLFGLTLCLRRYMEAETGMIMSLKRKETPLSGLVVVEQVQYRDNRGYFWEVFNSDTWKAVGFDLNFV